MACSYPIALNIENENCIVVGGGNVAARKIATLLEHGANVTILSPQISPEVEQLCNQHHLMRIADCYRDEYIKDAFLVIAATNHREINQKIATYCKQNKILVNVIDSLSESSFTVNAYLQRGKLQISVSTGGVSPAISKSIRESLETEFGEEYAQILDLISEIRTEAMEKIADSDKRRSFLQSLAKMDLIAIYQAESFDHVKNKVKTCLLSYLD